MTKIDDEKKIVKGRERWSDVGEEVRYIAVTRASVDDEKVRIVRIRAFDRHGKEIKSTLPDFLSGSYRGYTHDIEVIDDARKVMVSDDEAPYFIRCTKCHKEIKGLRLVEIEQDGRVPFVYCGRCGHETVWSHFGDMCEKAPEIQALKPGDYFAYYPNEKDLKLMIGGGWPDGLLSQTRMVMEHPLHGNRYDKIFLNHKENLLEAVMWDNYRKVWIGDNWRTLEYIEERKGKSGIIYVYHLTLEDEDPFHNRERTITMAIAEDGLLIFEDQGWQYWQTQERFGVTEGMSDFDIERMHTNSSYRYHYPEGHEVVLIKDGEDMPDVVRDVILKRWVEWVSDLKPHRDERVRECTERHARETEDRKMMAEHELENHLERPVDGCPVCEETEEEYHPPMADTETLAGGDFEEASTDTVVMDGTENIQSTPTEEIIDQSDGDREQDEMRADNDRAERQHDANAAEPPGE